MTTVPTGKDKFPESAVEVHDKNVPSVAGETLRPMPSARIRMAGRSRLAFSMPTGEEDLAFTIEAILDACRRWPMQLDVNAVPDPSLFRLEDQVALDSWLSHLAASGSWAQAAETLLSALGGSSANQSAMAGAAHRVAAKAIDAMRLGKTRGIEGVLRQAMNEELDVFAEHVAPLVETAQRDVATAALSLMTTQAIATYRTGSAFIDLLKDFPFLTVIFSPHQPAHNVTALELPYRLFLSPVPDSRWHHGTKPITRHERTELWHTRLTSTAADVGPDGPTRIRALWSPDYGLPGIVGIVNDNKPFRMSLDPLDREMLVKLMSGFDEITNNRRPFHPRTAEARRLALSSLGALLDAEGSWVPPGPNKISLEQWRHVATFGRDHYVRVVYRGFLKEFGHAASLIKVTERKFETHPETQHRVAVLRQRFFIVVRQPLKHYDGRGHAYGGRPFPFTDVEILTKVTPSLLAPDDLKCRLSDPAGTIYNPGTGVPNRACFWPMTSKTNNFLFQIAATDLSGDRVTFAMPLLFVGLEANENPTVLAEIIKQNNLTPASPRRTASLGNASVCYAPIKVGAEGDPRLPTASMVFKTALLAPNSVSLDEAQFYPEVEQASVGIAAIQRLLQKPDAMVDVSYPEVYKTTAGGFGGANAGEVFLKLQQPFDLAFGDAVKSDALGGLATPSMAIQGLSRIMGPVAAQKPAIPDPNAIELALKNVVSNKFNPADFFDGAKILGASTSKICWIWSPDSLAPTSQSS
ncbi:hypothetical protein [Rhizobium sp. RCAM05973]|uniref:hypothetical protein n=1 Tax=Rhizobium sp. RCAM05973 TaxID=2994066 RepID=UPI0022EBE285|nr:hypothetical protein [Rhizobium sp. RCAM05973]